MRSSAFVWAPLKKTLLSTSNKSLVQLLRSHTDGSVQRQTQYINMIRPLYNSAIISGKEHTLGVFLLGCDEIGGKQLNLICGLKKKKLEERNKGAQR